jgi:OmpA-OmpF porin, OOP family
VVFADDFMADNVGDCRRKWEFKRGNRDVVEWEATRFLRSTTSDRSIVAIVLPAVLPDRFTLELDYIISENHDGARAWMVIYSAEHYPGANHISVSRNEAGLGGGEVQADARVTTFFKNRPNRLMILGDGKYLKGYINDKRVFNVPNADFARTNKIWIWTYHATDELPLYIGNVRVAASDKKLYDALLANGRVATQGIYFDTGSDKIRPESSATLKEIGQMLKDHGDLRLMIEGHTDNVGTEAANQTLSDKRAAAVRQFLVANFGVDAARLESKGFGQSKPAAPNDTPEGRQSNRRVELVKL